MATICDIDDTLLRNGTQPIQRVIDYVNALPGAVIIVTGRNVSDRKNTVKALRAAGVKYSRLIMNPGSSSQTEEFKYDVGKRLKGSVNLAIDNNATMRAAYAKSGIKTMDPADIPSMKKFWQIWRGA
jgi:hydroxymethylpyrimidine pyrophosphatase-like HAD family hydrolase